MKYWKICGQTISLDKTLVMGILNVTPDSFSDGGRFFSLDDALQQAEKLVEEGADIIDVGGESTRPADKTTVDFDEEVRRTVPVIESIARRFNRPISVDTTKSEVAEQAINAGAEIINDISGLRFDDRIGKIAAKYGAGLVLMHSRGTFETLHSLPPVSDIMDEVTSDFRRAISVANSHGVANAQIVLDPGIGFGKSYEQNLELLAKLDKLKTEFADFPFLIGASRKSTIGKILGGVMPENRQIGSVAAAAIAAWNGAAVVRVHDIKETVEALAVVEAIKNQL
jgi:dihydropteroate synthase